MKPTMMDERSSPTDFDLCAREQQGEQCDHVNQDGIDAGAGTPAKASHFVCPSEQIQSRGDGFTFDIELNGEPVNAFIIRFRGELHGYVNRCPHIPEDSVNLDRPDGKFFDRMGRLLQCRRHSALFDPASGDCVRGPCRGSSLTRIDVAERAGSVFYLGLSAPIKDANKTTPDAPKDARARMAGLTDRY
ncbi:Rieske 2Fe-2S domain-containing protein [Lacisediminimonas sp.]|uniref:Rieske (2Fe-2S) protein n=1 Tax=Lacisediminimonas sp. TaxID=3060582 RepID=UPI00272293AE|nr:Rieske 2Fe-2S domain-containing protein [Lacisediminimonas sp.]MDO8301000.1 Rieske 2Fe-2S domain-containing protein [Lacisediminimonas sp.]